MSDKELIKQEIEKRLSLLWDLIPEGEKVLKDDFTKEDANNLGKYTELESLLKFIDSLPEEPTVKGITWEDVNKLESLIYQVHNEYPSIGEKSFGLEVLERFQDCQDDIEESASEDLEKEISKWRNHYISVLDNNLSIDLRDIEVTAKHFAEWQKQQDYKMYAHVPLKDIHDAWQELKKNKPDIENYPAICFQKGADWRENQMKKVLQTEYEKGRFDMREEMLKNAVGGVVHHFADDELAAVHYNDPKGTPMSMYILSKGLSAGDKVKIIIVKEEQP